MPPRRSAGSETRAAFTQLQRSRARASCGPVKASFVPAAPAADGIYPKSDTQLGSVVATPWCATACGDGCANQLGRWLRRSPVGHTSSGSSREQPGAKAAEARGAGTTSPPAGWSFGPDMTRTPDERPGMASRAALRALEAYQAAASGRVSPCRFYPSCSNYAREASPNTGSGPGSH